MTQANDIRDMAEAKLREMVVNGKLDEVSFVDLLSAKQSWRVTYHLIWHEAYAWVTNGKGSTYGIGKLTWPGNELRRWQATHASRPDPNT